MQDDQPRPDLDAAIKAVLPSLTAVSDDAAADSLRRTRIALATGAEAGRAFSWGWGGAATATAGVIVLTIVSLWLRPAPPSLPIADRQPGNPAVVAAPPASSPAARVTPAPSAPQRVASTRPTASRPERRRRVPVHATSAVDAAAPRQDPLVALVRAVQRIPEDAWQDSSARAEQSLDLPDVSLPPLDVTPLATPPLGGRTAEPFAPGEP